MGLEWKDFSLLIELALNTLISSLIEEELTVRGKSHFKELEGKWQELWTEEKDRTRDVLVEYNKFRLRNLYRTKIRRPAVLLGFVNDSHFPNFQTFSLLKVADVISLCCKGKSKETVVKKDDSIDRVEFDLIQDDIHSIQKKLPSGFTPTLYWDAQAVHGHVHPRGLRTAPFPSFAAVCHVHYGAAVKTICELFDYVIPVGECFNPSLSYGPAKVINLPFGMNWASFDTGRNNDTMERDIDISITFGPSNDPVYGGLRNKVIAALEHFQKKHGNISISIQSKLEKPQYFKILRRSKISINVVGINGPYNYRTCEIINSGSLLFQVNHTEVGIDLNTEESFLGGEDFISFTFDNLEDQLIQYLNDDQKRNIVVNSAIQKLEGSYSYEKGFLSIIEHSKRFNSAERKNPQNQNHAFNNGVFMWQQISEAETRMLGGAIIGTQLTQFNGLQFFGNLLAVLPELSNALGNDFVRNLVSQKNQALANQLDFNNPKQVAVQIYTQGVDNAAMCYNFISLSLQFGWVDIEQLSDIAGQAFNGFLFPDYDRSWLLRPCISITGIESNKLQSIRYHNFDLGLLKANNYETEWIAYRDYLLTLCKIGIPTTQNG